MNLAYEHYGQLGQVQDVSRSASYDYVVTMNGREWHVEVKGTTGDGSQVLLTPNEVQHAQEYANVALFVVSKIALDRDGQGNVTAGGGVTRIVQPWTPRPMALAPVGYRYTLEPESDSALLPR